MDPREQLSHILPTLKDVVDGVHPRQLGDATACSEFKVRDVIDHMVVLGGSFAYMFRGEDAPEIGAPETLGWVPAREFRQTMDDLLDAVNSPGAMERTVSSPVGDMSGETFARFVAFDGLVHGWDLTAATGLTYAPPSAVVSAVDQFAREALSPEMRDGDTFKEATTPPDAASPLERLVAFSGRSL
jgi:uncharacterized protein (TIGR03086 family)